jgi:tRNA-splicing ligase RtcB
VLLDILRRGAEWAVEQGCGSKEDLLMTEECGRMKAADPSHVSARAMERGLPQLGTLGAGNHFLEIQKVSHIYDKEKAAVFGIQAEGQVTVMIHCGSRGLGHQVASDSIEIMENAYGTKGLPDRELVNAPVRSRLGQEYYASMCAAVNFAFANRQMIAHWVRDVFARVMGSSEGMRQIYDVCHNVAKMERHEIGGREREVCIHRKGATRSFGPGRPEIPEVYRPHGQPVIIPGSMGTASYLLAGTAEAEALSFSSTAHGAGRVMSRHEALRRFRGEEIRDDLRKRGIELQSASWKGIAEEASEAYKDVDEVVRVSHEVGIGGLVARLVPVGVMKG